MISIRDLKYLLVKRQEEITEDFQNIVVVGDLKFTRKPWTSGRRFGLFFDLVDNTESISSCLWLNSREEVERVQSFEYKKVQVKGDITINKIYSNFQLNVSTIELVEKEQSYLEKLKNECIEKGFFRNKKKVPWLSIQKVLLISKKDTQGYTDFIKQLYIPVDITNYEIPLEGPTTSSSIIECLKNYDLKSFQLIIILRGGGNTTEISNSFDKIELFQEIKSCTIPILTAIGHANDTKDKLLITEVSDFDIETPTSLAKYINQIFFEKLNQSICLELEKNYEEIFKIQEKKKNKLYKKIHTGVKDWINRKSRYHIIDCSVEKEIILCINGKYYKQTIDLSNEIQIDHKEENFLKELEIELNYNNIEKVYKMIESYQLESISTLCKDWIELEKEIKIPEKTWNLKKVNDPISWRGMLLSIQKDFLFQPLEKKIFQKLKTLFL
jgi:exodeoxyribonuclease VII large subunit